ncbi:uncharacterized protein HaLaN_09324 [Haematococcus lacustris]|uniref:Uncharacterized protein n=1 Tax=Haematococcus lacustris TaxID=44745 RepID=A0A699Z1Q5_HAELA|nr:uncharacterized protein HaLaN_09324 [Haematococcus lacustris]
MAGTGGSAACSLAAPTFSCQYSAAQCTLCLASGSLGLEAVLYTLPGAAACAVAPGSCTNPGRGQEASSECQVCHMAARPAHAVCLARPTCLASSRHPTCLSSNGSKAPAAAQPAVPQHPCARCLPCTPCCVSQEGDSSSDAAVLAAKLKMVQLARLLRVGAIVQDLADASLAINDIRGNKDPILSHPLTLAVAGLVSGSISGYKNWIS